MSAVRSNTLTAVNAGLSFLMCVGFFVGYFVYGSSLALAQGADSLLDVLTAVILAWAVRIAATPGDDRHPAGHRSAEPLAAMWVAAMAALLSYRVAASSIEALWTGRALSLGPALLSAFGIKALVRGALVVIIDRSPPRERGPAMTALRVDARNDVLLSLGALLAAYATRWHPLADPAVALPMALWIGWSGYELGRENTRLLMGEAPDPERIARLRQLAGRVDGIRGVHDVRAHYVGDHLSVHLHVVVDPEMRIVEAHDLGEQVRFAVEAEPDVDRCNVHIDVSSPGQPGHH